jgi:hypothetical protein
MNESKEDALQAAMLAKFVGGQLSKIDQMSYDRSLQANRLDMNHFISKVVNSNQPQQPQNGYIPPTPAGFAKPPSEDVIRQMVPEPPPRAYKDEQPTLTTTSVSNEKVEKLLENIDNNLQLLISLIKNG